MANQPASGVSFSADGKTLTVHGQTLNYVFPYTGTLPVQASDLAPLRDAAEAAATTVDMNASIAALKTTQGAIIQAVLAIQAALKPPAAGSFGPVSLRQIDGTGGIIQILWTPTNAADKPPTFDYNGKPVQSVDAMYFAP